MVDILSNFVEEIISIDVEVLITIVIIISVEVVGVTEFLKNFFSCKKGARLAITSLLVTVACSYMNTTLVPPILSTIFDIAALSLAITTCAYNVLVKAIPRGLSSLIDKSLGSKSSG